MGILNAMKVLRPLATNNWSFLCTKQPKLSTHTQYTFIMVALPFCWVKLINIFKQCHFLPDFIVVFLPLRTSFDSSMLNALYFWSWSTVHTGTYIDVLPSCGRVELNHSVTGVLHTGQCVGAVHLQYPPVMHSLHALQHSLVTPLLLNGLVRGSAVHQFNRLVLTLKYDQWTN